MKNFQMIIEKHYNRMLRIFKAYNEALKRPLKCDPQVKTHIKYFFMPHIKGPLINFFYNKMNTDIKQGS